MPLDCQLIRPSCFVVGVETHPSIGIVPPGIPTPCEICFWLSQGDVVMAMIGDQESDNVIACSEGVVKRGSDTTWMRKHYSIFSIPPITPPVSDLGLIILHTALGSTKTIWGPFSVKAQVEGAEESVAVIMLVPGFPFGPMNDLQCGDPTSSPMAMAMQRPSTVLAGMTLGDIVGCMLMAWLDELLSLITGGATGLINRRIGSRLARALGLRDGAATILMQIVEGILDWVEPALHEQLRDQLTNDAPDRAFEAIGEGVAGEVNDTEAAEDFDDLAEDYDEEAAPVAEDANELADDAADLADEIPSPVDDFMSDTFGDELGDLYGDLF